MTWVYFIQAQESGRIKIGFSENPLIRLTQLRTGSCETLAMKGLVAGSSKDEAALHVKFAASRLTGEWFRPDPELLDYIAESAVDIEVYAKIETLSAKAYEYQSMAEGCLQHADELRRYLRQRNVAEAS